MRFLSGGGRTPGSHSRRLSFSSSNTRRDADESVSTASPAESYPTQNEINDVDSMGQRLLDIRRSDMWRATSSNASMAPLSITERVPDNVLGSTLRIVGEIHFERLLRIDGRFQGTLKGNGSIIIGPSGCVTADLVDLEQIYIEGRLTGDIVNAAEVQVRGSAIVSGNIRCASLALDPAVRLHGGNVTICPEGPFPIIRPETQSMLIGQYDAFNTQDSNDRISTTKERFNPEIMPSDDSRNFISRDSNSLPRNGKKSSKSSKDRENSVRATNVVQDSQNQIHYSATRRPTSMNALRIDSGQGENSPLSSASDGEEWLKDPTNHELLSDSDFNSDSTGDCDEWVHQPKMSPVGRKEVISNSKPLPRFATTAPLQSGNDSRSKGVSLRGGELRSSNISEKDFAPPPSSVGGKSTEKSGIMERVLSSRTDSARSTAIASTRSSSSSGSRQGILIKDSAQSRPRGPS